MRADHDLAFMMRYENIAWYDGGVVRILDRRIYPAKISFVECRTYQQVAGAIRDMVTQSAGPYSAAPMGMALAAHQCEGLDASDRLAFLNSAAVCISNARPTTKKRLELCTAESMRAAQMAVIENRDITEAVFENALEQNERRYRGINKIAKYLAELLPDGGTVMTQCFAETACALMLRECRERKKKIRLFCPETRPYFQGARLTASVACEMGFDVTVITDNMPAAVMAKEGVDIFTSAADAICMDGSVINKIGTYQIAIAAKYHGIPYYVTGAPEKDHVSGSSVVIEQRDPEFVLQAMGVRTAMQGVKGYYPSFDLTPPELVSGVVTDRGIYKPQELADYFRENEEPGFMV